jgi:hypothetical protein
MKTQGRFLNNPPEALAVKDDFRVFGMFVEHQVRPDWHAQPGRGKI